MTTNPAEHPHTELLHLIPKLYGAREPHLITITDPDLLEAVRNHCVSSILSITHGMATIGKVLACSQMCDFLDEGDVSNFGGLIQELANLTEALGWLESTAEYTRTHPDPEWLKAYIASLHSPAEQAGADS